MDDIVSLAHTQAMRGAATALPVLVAIALAGCLATTSSAPVSPAATSAANFSPPPLSVRVTPSPVPSLPGWTSIHWTPADPTPFSGPGNQYIFDGVAWGPGAILVGEVAPLPDGNVVGAVWASPDELHWQLVPNAGGVFAGSEIRAVATDGSRIVAVGVSRLEDNATTLTPPIGLAWVSTDGARWARVPDGNGVLGQVVLHGIVAGPTGFIGYGNDLAGAPAIVVSADGRVWRRDATAEGAFAGSSISAMISTGSGLVAVGSDDVRPKNGVVSTLPGPAAAWWSLDGRTWRKADLDPGHYAFESVQPWVNSLRALGSSDCPGCISPPLNWSSTDAGRTWRSLPGSTLPNPSQLSPSAVAFDNRAVELVDQPTTVNWTTDGQTWMPLQSVGVPPSPQSQILLGSDERILVIGSSTGAGPNDQEDARVWLGTVQ